MNQNEPKDHERARGAEHLVCEFCKEEFDALETFLQHKGEAHGDELAAQGRILDEQVEESFPASDSPTSTSPTEGMGETNERR